ncbi:cytochrome o ubiquinol oxidase subunit III [Alicyclobacillus contaminans]|uniref:cytochrome o ubiquinol oxidase subunit III n=1 Tax=Alicyclobacillus contaminans TaxID=392016 RepID=UPI000A057CFD|nr:cytochrome o ubiquinol oxidase subunit III [Alicyclobacillus contaminans]
MAHEEVLSTPSSDVPVEYSTEDGALKIFGFWIFLATDLILFACLFTMYQILHINTAGGPTEQELYDVPGFTAETLILLVSSFTCGLATLEMRRGRRSASMGWLVVTVLLGLSFIFLEVREFVDYVNRGATMQRSAFLSSFFTLVGTHGCHVSLGILWMLSILYQLGRRGISAMTARKIFIVGLYWHFLDVVWVFIFTVVYLQGVM